MGASSEPTRRFTTTATTGASRFETATARKPFRSPTHVTPASGAAAGGKDVPRAQAMGDTDSLFTVPIGATAPEFAGELHQDLSGRPRSARVWGSARFDGQVVQRHHILEDGDIVELTMR